MAIKCIEVAFTGFVTQILEVLAELRGVPIRTGIEIVGVETDQATITGSGLSGNVDWSSQQWDRPRADVG